MSVSQTTDSRFDIGISSITDLRNVRYELKSRISKGIVSFDKTLEQGTALERSPHHVIHCQGVHGRARNLETTVAKGKLLSIRLRWLWKNFKTTYLYVNNEEEFRSTSFCIFLHSYNQHQRLWLHFPHSYAALVSTEYVVSKDGFWKTCVIRKTSQTWTIPPGRPPRLSSRLSDLNQSAPTSCIKVPFALIW